MTRKYLNRNLISKTGMSFSIKTASNEFSPYNQAPWLLPPRLLQLTLPRSFPLLYCFQMLLGMSSSGSCVIATSTGECGSVWVGCEASAQPLRGPSDTAAELLGCSHIIKTHRRCSARASPDSSGWILTCQDTRRHQEGRLLMKELVGLTPTRGVLAVVHTAPVGPFRFIPLI